MESSPEEAAPPLVLDLEAEAERTRACADGVDLFLGNLGFEVDEAFLEAFFSPLFASVVLGSAQVKRTADGAPKGYGFVTFSELRDANAARDQFDGQFVGSTRVRLSCCRWRSAEELAMSQEQLQQLWDAAVRAIEEQNRLEDLSSAERS